MDADAPPIDRLWVRGRDSVRDRLARLRAKRWQIAQCAAAAGVSWLIAADLFGHPRRSSRRSRRWSASGTSYGQRLRRVAEVTPAWRSACCWPTCWRSLIGSGWWQLTLVVTLSMCTALLITGGQPS